MRAIVSLFLFVVMLRTAAASVSLLPPASRWISGMPVEVDVFVTDGSLPERLTLQITNARGFTLNLPIRRREVTGPVGRYESVLPADVNGRLLVRIDGDKRAPYVVEVLTSGLASTAPAEPTYAESADASQPKAPPPAEFSWVDAFYTHEPIYFVGAINSDSDSKFQLSFKYQIYSRDSTLPKRLADAWLAPSGLYGTYTQTSLWDISADSSPFRDTSYKPGLYWQERDVWYREDQEGRARLSIMAGLEHESNGRGGILSRSINVAAFRPTLGYVSSGGWRFLVSPKLYAYLEKGDNGDIEKYRGYADLLVLARMPSSNPDGGLQLSLTGRMGTDTDHSSVQGDLTYPIRIFDVPGYVAAQVFSGHGEAILDYNRRRATQIRIGFAASR